MDSLTQRWTLFCSFLFLFFFSILHCAKKITLKGIWKLFDFNIFQGVRLGLSPKIAIVNLASYHVLNVCYIFKEVFSFLLKCARNMGFLFHTVVPLTFIFLFLVGKLMNSGLGRREGGRANSKHKSRRISSFFPQKTTSPLFLAFFKAYKKQEKSHSSWATDIAQSAITEYVMKMKPDQLRHFTQTSFTSTLKGKGLPVPASSCRQMVMHWTRPQEFEL